jgi:benzoyl-CoA reductase subunit BamC
MSKPAKKKKIKEIKVDLSKCNGCRACEKACAAFHAIPKYSSFNPARSRIKVIIDERNDQWVPVRASGYTQAECNGRNHYVIEGKEYSECAFCPASCPSRDWFKEPDSGLPLKCDMCEDVPPLAEPMCVQMCARGCLTYSEREAEVVEEEVTRGEMEMGIESMIKKYGAESVSKAVSRATKRSSR